MKVVFCGTPDFAVPTLRAVVDAGHEVLLVATQPDRPSGRGLAMSQPAVKAAALALGMGAEQILQPEKIKINPEFRARLEGASPDAILVVAYGRIIPGWMLALPPLGNINLHGSLLPKYRGAAPVQWAIANGEAATGVTTMRIDAGLDTGDMLLRRAVPIGPEQTARDMFPVLAEAGAKLMVETLAGLAANTIEPVPQDNTLATLAPILVREDAQIDFGRPAQAIHDRWRGFQPWPGAYTFWRGKKLIVHGLRVATGSQGFEDRELGTILAVKAKLLAQCGNGTLMELVEVQLEGKKRMPAPEFSSGYQVKIGERLG